MDMLERSIMSAEKSYEATVVDLENSRVAFEEERFYFDEGDRTALELEEARMSFTNAGQRRYQGAIDLLTALGEYAVYFDVAEATRVLAR